MDSYRYSIYLLALLSQCKNQLQLNSYISCIAVFFPQIRSSTPENLKHTGS